MKRYYQRNLPHWHPPGAPVFVTCRLAGSLPKSAIEALKRAQLLIEREIAQATSSDEAIAKLKVRHYKRLFAKFDSILDKAATGPRWLGEPEIASVVEDAILRRYAELYELWAYVVMVNHLHLLLQAKPTVPEKESSDNAFVSLASIMKGIKGFTAREANRRLRRTESSSGNRNRLITGLAITRSSYELLRILKIIQSKQVSLKILKNGLGLLPPNAKDEDGLKFAR